MPKKPALCEVVLPVWAEQLRLAQSGSEQAVFDMMKAFSTLLSQNPQEGQAPAMPVPADLVDQMYRGFQYQDSLSQILAILIRDMERMQQALGSPRDASGPTAPDAWMERLQSEFVMQAQRNPGLSAQGSGGTQDADDLTFF